MGHHTPPMSSGFALSRAVDQNRKAQADLEFLASTNPERAKAFVESHEAPKRELQSIPGHHLYKPEPRKACTTYRPVRYQQQYVAREEEHPKPNWRSLLQFGF